jgi:hypothetical protein
MTNQAMAISGVGRGDAMVAKPPGQTQRTAVRVAIEL